MEHVSGSCAFAGNAASRRAAGRQVPTPPPVAHAGKQHQTCWSSHAEQHTATQLQAAGKQGPPAVSPPTCGLDGVEDVVQSPAAVLARGQAAEGLGAQIHNGGIVQLGQGRQGEGRNAMRRRACNQTHSRQKGTAGCWCIITRRCKPSKPQRCQPTARNACPSRTEAAAALTRPVRTASICAKRTICSSAWLHSRE